MGPKPAQLAYTGSLRPKRKQELVEIAESLGIDLPEGQSFNKIELEEMIRAHLGQPHKPRANPKRKTARTSSASSTWTTPSAVTDEDDEDDDDDGDDRDAAAGADSIENTSPLSLVKDVGSSIVRLGNHVVAVASPSSPLRANPAAAQQGQLVRRASFGKSLGQSKSIQNLRAAAKKAEGVVGTTQQNFSHAWVVTAVAAQAEWAWVVNNAVPWYTKTVGPYKWLTRSGTTQLAVPLPSVDVLLHTSFVYPALHWLLYTVLVPLVIALVFSFPRQAKHRTRSTLTATRISPPNAVVFNVARLAVGVLVHYIFAKSTKASSRHWSFESVDGFPEIQLLGAAVAGVLAAYAEAPKA